MGRRIEYIDAIKGFAIFLVLWGHCIQFFSTNNCFDDKTFSFIYSFHMPLFMMICGFFFTHSLKKDTKTFLIQTIQRFLIPIILCGILLIAFSRFINGTFNLKELLLNLHTIPFTQFWFIRDVFVFYIMTYFIFKYSKNLNKTFLICSLLILLSPNKLWSGWMHIYSMVSSSTLYMFPYFWVGIFLYKYYTVYELYKKESLYISLILFCILLLFWDGNYTYYQTPIYPLYTYNNGFVITFFNNFPTTLLRYTIGLSGGFFFWCLFDYNSITILKIPSLSSIGKNTLGIYIIQTFVIEQLMAHYIKFQVNTYIYDWIITPIIALSLTYILNYFINILKRNKYASVLIGNIYTNKI